MKIKSHRIAFINELRKLVMVLMALDHKKRLF
jgi:uncharacterized membrane protein